MNRMTAKLIALISLTTLISATHAGAVQFRMSDGDAEIMAHVSKREITRIALRGDRISGVVGKQLGFRIEHDTTSGDMFLVPNDGADLVTPINLFISSEAGNTYQLLLTPLDIPAEQIVIVGKPGSRADIDIAPRREALAALVRAMITGDFLDDYTAVTPALSDLDHISPEIKAAEIIEVRQGSYFRGLKVMIGTTELATITLANLAPDAAAVWLSKTGDEAIIVVESHHE